MAKDKTDIAQPTASTGGYPYVTLIQSKRLGSAAREHGGRDVPRELIADSLKMDRKSQGFYQLIASAVTFGIIEPATSRISLTDAARRYFSGSESEKRVADLGFLASPPKFKLLLDSFDGGELPSKKMLVNKVNKSGVAPTWAARTVSLFLSAATELGVIDSAGFMRFGAALHKAERATEFQGSESPAQEDLRADNAVVPQPTAGRSAAEIGARGFRDRHAVNEIIPDDGDESRNVMWYEGMRVETPNPLTRKLWNKLKLMVEMMEPTDEP